MPALVDAVLFPPSPPASHAHAHPQVVEQQTEIEDRVARERLGALRSDIARVVRERILPMAERLMQLHAGSRHALEIQFEGESGFG